MRTTVALSALAALATTIRAAPAAQDQTYALQVIDSGTPLQYQAIAATNGVFSIAAEATVLQPDGSAALANVTALTVGSAGACALAVDVPGGQLVYVASNGQLSYETPHNHAQDLASRDFSVSAASDSSVNDFLYRGQKTWLACPSDKDSSMLQIVSGTAASPSSACKSIGIIAVPVQAPDVYAFAANV